MGWGLGCLRGVWRGGRGGLLKTRILGSSMEWGVLNRKGGHSGWREGEQKRGECDSDGEVWKLR